MNRGLKVVSACALAWASLAALQGVHAQGVTTAAVSGRVTDAGGQPMAGVQVSVTNRSTGFRTGTLTRVDGRYQVSSLEVGGPYQIVAQSIGFTTRELNDIYLTIGQNFRADFNLAEQAVALEAITVQTSQVFTTSRTGASTLVNDTMLRRLPTLNRNFTDFVQSVPQISASGPGLSGGGVNNRYNNIQIDGASENDLFGLGSTGQPGGQARGKSISIEAVREYQVLLAPFDVRLGNFAGALINAVTKSGTNEFHGTGFYVTRNEDLARDAEIIKASPFKQSQFGGSIGGPLIRDRVHFFLAPEFQTRDAPASGPFLGQTSNLAEQLPVAQADVERFISILNRYGLSAGTAGPVSNQNPLSNIFGRVDVANLPWNSRLVLRYNYGRAEDDIFSRSVATFPLTSNAYFFESVKHAPVAQLFTNLSNGGTNELMVGYNRIRDRRTPAELGPQISVTVPRLGGGNSTLRAGAEQFSQGNELDQDILEITNNLTIPVGMHRFTFGARAEFFDIRNLFTESSAGVWSFSSLNNFDAGTPSSYRVAKDLGNGVEANFGGVTYSAYIQDQLQPNDRLSINLGLRIDVPTFSDPPLFTPVVDSIYRRRTDEMPSGNLHISPRLGFNYDLSKGLRRQLRGGLGVFTGRPAFVWVGNIYQNSGSNLGFLNCSTSSADPGLAPTFNAANATTPPAACANGQGLRTGVVGPVNVLDKDLKFPQTMRGSLAYDHELPWGVVATAEVLYTRYLNNFFYANLNLAAPDGVGRDRNGRVIYGDSIRTNGAAAPRVVSTRFSEVIDVENQSEDYSYQLTGQLDKRFANGLQFTGSYTYSTSKDIQSLTSSRAISNWQFGRTLSGSHRDANLTTSLFEQKHKIVAAGTYTFAWRRFPTDLSMTYTGQSGPPFDYIYLNGPTSGSGDLNADTRQGNDLIYVPQSATDPNEIQFRDATFSGQTVTAAQQAAAFEEFINGSDCLSKQRGQIMERNSCRAPWQNILNISVRQSLPTIAGQNLTLQADVFNFLNLLNEDWGRLQFASNFNNVGLLTHVGQTPGPLTTSQGIFQYNPQTQRFNSNNVSSNYQIQLSLRYSF
jgi:outer membrane receptor protein involved in Fe transport